MHLNKLISCIMPLLLLLPGGTAAGQATQYVWDGGSLELQSDHVWPGSALRFTAKTDGRKWFSVQTDIRRRPVLFPRYGNGSPYGSPLTIQTGEFQYPGLYEVRCTSEGDSVGQRFFLSVASRGATRSSYPAEIRGLLPNTLHAVDPARLSKIHLFRDSVSLVFARMQNIVPRRTDVVMQAYVIDSFYRFVDSLAAKMARTRDTGTITEAAYAISLDAGITLVHLAAEPKETAVQDTSRAITNRILTEVSVFWKKDSLIVDDIALNGLLKTWREDDVASGAVDGRGFYKRKDQFIVPEYLRMLMPSYAEGRSAIWLGISDKKTFPQFLLVFRLVAPEKKRTL